jgi:ABC-type lipoprotein export system ATPase subunit
MSEQQQPILNLQHISKSYGSAGDALAVEVLADVSLTVAAGEALAVVGPSGSGKSTLLNIMGGLDVPSSGTVELAGQDLAGLKDSELARVRNQEVGFIFQLHHLLPQCTVLENVLVPTLPFGCGEKRAAATERAGVLLDRVGLGARLQHLPGQLSGGERQRVAVVRALINQPRLLLADEPTGSLDHASATALGELLRELNEAEQVTLVVVTHSVELAGSMARMYQLRDGHLHA